MMNLDAGLVPGLAFFGGAMVRLAGSAGEI
jgi:hypothetical protein